ncbi:hypothetical protein SBRY_10499 [Actinacidiphila bryophytorum]|uniref:Uncharacterized protein n=1 Tax=Actinacidiphila bryophytorum TaxID=1436133 RepID=A0A9W4GYR2_9ACTN|nr:hypothetical protein SBRY_10499 [Actinacidiphila bryophytorum]
MEWFQQSYSKAAEGIFPSIPLDSESRNPLSYTTMAAAGPARGQHARATSIPLTIRQVCVCYFERTANFYRPAIP